MPRWKTVGEVRRTVVRLEWRVKDTYFMPENGESYIGSPPFPYANCLWYITKWPNGCSGPSYYNWFGLSLCGTSSECPVLNVKLGIKRADGRDLKVAKGETSPYGCFEEPRYVKPGDIWKMRGEIAHNGYITVFCEFRREEDDEFAAAVMPTEPTPSKEEADDSEAGAVGKETPKSKSYDKLLQDLKDLLLREDDSDVTIKVQDKEFRAHRNILRVRCPVFHSMFKHQMLEETSGVVEIDDCAPDTFPDFLHYIYTGTVENLSAENVFSLYTVADKYCVQELKNECIEFVKVCLSVGTFCDVMTLSLRYSEEELKELASRFFSKNVSKIVVTDEWETFLNENTAEGNKLLVKALGTRKKTV